MTACTDALKQQGNELFDKRGSLMTLWQEQAENFYPQRADFTATRQLGTDFAANLMTSYPLLVARDLSNAFGSMLRSGQWFNVRTNRPDRENTEARQFLEWLTGLQRNAMYDRAANFVRSTKEADADFAVFGQAVIQSNFVKPIDGSLGNLLHRTWHLRDCAWIEDETGRVRTLFRKWQPYLWEVCAQFPGTVNDRIRERCRTNPYERLNCWHILMPSDRYNGMDGAEKINERLHKFVSIFLAVDENLELETKGQRIFTYTVPRWQTVSGSQYAFSPSVIAALPDARLCQAIARVLLEAGEKAVNPPMIGVRDVMRSDLEYFAGGFTAVDGDYEGNLENVLRPLNIDSRNLSFGEGLLKDIREQLTGAFMLNKLTLPPSRGGDKMTAYETEQRIEEYIRTALPLFEPIETGYNGGLCEVDLELLFENSAEIRRLVPKGLQGAEWKFEFESPIKRAADKVKIGQWQQATQIITAALPLSQSAAFILNDKDAVRDVMLAAVPASWLNTEDVVERQIAAKQAEDQRNALLQKLSVAASTAKDAGAGLASGAQGLSTAIGTPSPAMAA